MTPLQVGEVARRPNRFDAGSTPPPTTTSVSGAPRPPVSLPKHARFVWLFRVAADTLPNPLTETPYWVAEADAEGNYRLEGLPLDTPFRFLSLYDADRSRSPGGPGDYWTFDPEALTLTAETPRIEGRTAYLVDPKSPGRLSGRLDALIDTAGADSAVVGILAAVRAAGIDSLVMTWPPTSVAKATRAAADGTWSLVSMPPARYRLAAWLDENRNGQLEANEPIGSWIEAVVAPDEDVTNCQLARPTGR